MQEEHNNTPSPDAKPVDQDWPMQLTFVHMTEPDYSTRPSSFPEFIQDLSIAEEGGYKLHEVRTAGGVILPGNKFCLHMLNISREQYAAFKRLVEATTWRVR